MCPVICFTKTRPWNQKNDGCLHVFTMTVWNELGNMQGFRVFHVCLTSKRKAHRIPEILSRLENHVRRKSMSKDLGRV